MFDGVGKESVTVYFTHFFAVRPFQGEDEPREERAEEWTLGVEASPGECGGDWRRLGRILVGLFTNPTLFE
jgi:hypothetical protein